MSMNAAVDFCSKIATSGVSEAKELMGLFDSHFKNFEDKWKSDFTQQVGTKLAPSLAVLEDA